ncbi:hypothetical protein BT67DRAFT_443881 [Trichocladium antarcticum]|uniref:Uncharacterized protein n=1 Tax=Trichocladium antarcticum TaxID=1450529 RepID=A0AAN6UFX7_9PEZI|nr:hypothetical protein BT67DRAFT_443881 [Trichocladium antarcticum]
MTFTPEEQALVDRLEKGVVVPFDPKMTHESLSGYGAAIATDVPLGQVETAIRTMRLMTGGIGFNAESDATADVTAIMKRYDEKKPIFVHSAEEKAWIERAKPKYQVSEPSAEIKKAIVDTAILGKYETTTYAQLADTSATMANYHGRTYTYKASDSQRFMDKVESLLPKKKA